MVILSFLCDDIGDEAVAVLIRRQCGVEVGPEQVRGVVRELGVVDYVIAASGAFEFDGMADRAANERKQLIEAVGAVRCGGHSEHKANVEVCEDVG